MKRKKKEIKPAQGVHWDLSDLYKSIDDPQIAKDKQIILEQTKQFIRTYKGNINISKVSPDFLLKAIKAYEAIFEKAYIYGSYASYLYATNTQDAKTGKFYQASEEFFSMLRAQLLWFDLEIIEIPDNVIARLRSSRGNPVETSTKVMGEKTLDSYYHYLTSLRVFKPYTLSEKEEMILTQKAQTSGTAFVRLYDQTSASMNYILKLGKKTLELSYSELAPFLTAHKERSVRKNAAEALSKGLKQHATLYTFILNTLLLDKKISDELRGYHYPQEQTFLSYEIQPKTVKSMTDAIQKRYNIAEKYYLAKKKVLGLERLYEWDRYSGLTIKEEKQYSWEEAKKIVLQNFKSFSPVFREIAEKFFNKNWIDAEITPGKRDGAFCSYNTPNKHPYILVNFNGTVRDVETLAHELGHGIHGYLAGQNHTLLEAWPSTATAEIASVFCENIVFEALYKEQTDKKIKQSMLAERIQSSFATIFRQNAFYLFESDIHELRRTSGELSTDDFNDLFQKQMQAMFGKGLTLTDNHKYWWMPILHFYHYNFYVFSYAFGEMMSIALYARYKKEGKGFVDDYIKALSIGGSKNPYVITKTMGIEVNAPDFWERGLSVIEQYVDEFIKLSKG